MVLPPSAPGAGISANSEDSLCLAGSVTLRSLQEGTDPGPPTRLSRTNQVTCHVCLYTASAQWMLWPAKPLVRTRAV